MTPYFPDVEILYPGPSTTISTTQTNQIIQYSTSNLTSGYWTLNGANVGALNINGTSAQISGLQYGNNSICIIGLGLSNLVDSDCIDIWREYPPVTVVITSPLIGSLIYGQTAVVNYTTANVTSAKWWLDGLDVGEVQLNHSSRTFSALTWGNHTICITPFGLDGQHPDVCTNFNITAPPLDLQITSPSNGSSVPQDQVTLDYIINNATGANWTLNGVPVSSVTLWAQQNVILNLQLGANIICIEAWGQNGQQLTECITIIGHSLDSDSDGVPDHSDNCPNTPIGTIVTSDGCTDPTSDIDQDGVPDLDDICPNTPTTEIADENGCGPSQKDSDNDGVSDADDACNNTAPGAAIDSTGCANSQVDSDGDGVFDDVDAFPLDPTQNTDNDGDGYGDDINGNNPDFFPNDSTQWSDYDRDGWGDNVAGNNSDECPLIAGVIDGVPGKGCPEGPDEPVNNNTNNNTNNNSDGNQTVNQTAPNCPLCGLNYNIPTETKVNQSVQFVTEVIYTLGANFWDNYTVSWDFGDGNNSNDLEPSHTYIEVPSGGTYAVTLCINFEEGPESCKTGDILILPEDVPQLVDENNSDNQTDETTQEATNVGGSFELMGLVGIITGGIFLLLATLLIMKIRGKSSRSEDNAPFEQLEVTEAQGGEQQALETIEHTEEVISETSQEFEWLEHPEGSGEWFYRNPGDEDWIYFEQH
tara:strand:- start:1269 stop:3368 length:2100 start_codon:yes stop_codon:yes gene_type:complete